MDHNTRGRTRCRILRERGASRKRSTQKKKCTVWDNKGARISRGADDRKKRALLIGWYEKRKEKLTERQVRKGKKG